MNHPTLIVMSGLPGSGKSSVAEGVAKRLNIPVLSVDPIESAILKAGIAKSFETGLAAYLVAEAIASEQLKLGHSVIIDAVNAEEEGKNVWRGLAQKHGLTLTVIDVSNSNPALHRRRLEQRVRGLHGFEEITWDKVEARKKNQTTWKEPALRLDSINDLDSNVAEAVRFIEITD